MGQLDDAIREHLDLKRRRGADPAEIARAEQEALGPVRREPVASEPVDEPHEPHEEHAADAATSEPPRTAGDKGGAADTAGSEGAERAAAPTAKPVGGDDAREQEPDPTAPARGSDRSDDAAPAAAEDPRHSDIVHQPTTEFRVEDHHDDEDEPPRRQPDTESPGAHGDDDENVLEETPDFLQETPEHDRLWFEQRPPRDFDFDG
jgi:hypothetical protein